MAEGFTECVAMGEVFLTLTCQLVMAIPLPAMYTRIKGRFRKTATAETADQSCH